MSDPLQKQAEALADQAAGPQQATDNAAPEGAQGTAARRRGRGRKPAPPAPKRRAAGLLSHESHTRDIPAVAAELGLPVHTVRSIVTRAIQEWQARNPVRELVREHFDRALARVPTAQ